eukprot:TRINITY_DN14134_c0_g1_i1.p1 TRINITY_DN14134_c0_g1~~TRINITY_DN14134_c0_g1_i1.p1  ORF type:complete len:404 (+),score=49.92 TRINITY_DN14134_c0_g1_i1:39-1214(+)
MSKRSRQHSDSKLVAKRSAVGKAAHATTAFSTSLCDLPDELIQSIAVKLTLAEIAGFALVSKRLSILVGDDAFWKSMCDRYLIDITYHEEDFTALFRQRSARLTCLFLVDQSIVHEYEFRDFKWEHSKRKVAKLRVNGNVSRYHLCQNGPNTVCFLNNLGDLFTYNVHSRTAVQRVVKKLPQAIMGGIMALISHRSVLYGISCDDQQVRSLCALYPGASEWVRVRNLARGGPLRYSPAVGVIGERIYISDLWSTEYYDIATNQCVQVSGKSASGAAYCVYEERLYVLDGVDSRLVGQKNCFRCYDPKSDVWTTLASLPEMDRLVQRLAGLVVFEDRLLAMTISLFEMHFACYEPTMDCWSAQPSSGLDAGMGMGSKKFGQGMFVFVRPPNI